MKYETVIKILSFADSEHEAIDIAGEFLRGNLESGVEMKCYTRPAQPFRLFGNQIKKNTATTEE
jgi:hypothetical protein